MKDVDGLHPFNAGQLFLGPPDARRRRRRVGVMRLLDEYKIPIAGARAVVVGRSLIVGQAARDAAAAGERHGDDLPLAHARISRGTRSTPTSSSRPSGHPGLITADMVKQGAAVVDVGMNRTEGGLFGDVDPGVADVAAFLTPVPGGVGPMTIACLLENALKAARYRSGALAFPRI